MSYMEKEIGGNILKEKAGWELREGTVAYGKVSDDQLWSVINKTF